MSIAKENNKDVYTNPPLVSVVMPAYNCEKFIGSAIETVLDQSYNYIELIVVDDGSTDRTPSILRTFNNRIKLIEQENLGVSAARNAGIHASIGDYISFLDADDLWSIDKIKRQISALGDNYWSYTDCYYIGDGQSSGLKRSDLSSLYDGWIFDDILDENFLTTSSILIKKDVLELEGCFDVNLEVLEDWKLWIKLARKYPISLVKEPLVSYRVYNNSTSRKARKVLPYHIDVINEVFRDLPDNYKNRKKRRRSLSKSYSICSYISEDANDHFFAFFCSVNSAIYNPFSLTNYKRVIRSIFNVLFSK